MSDYFDLTNLTSSNSLLGFMRFNNEVTGGFFSIFILAGWFLIVFFSSRNSGNSDEVSFVLSSFLSFIVSVLMVIGNILPTYLSLLPLAMTLIGTFILIRQN